MQDDEPASTEAEAVCSSNSCESFAWFDRDSWSWKTSQRCLVEGWATYSESFPRAGTMRNGIAYRRQASAPLTGGTGCLSSGHNVPTPTKSDAQRMPNTGRNSHGPTIHEIAEQAIPIRMWPTPHGMSPDGRSHGPSGNELGRAVNRAMWPTPKTQDCRAAKYDRGKSNLGEEVYASVPEATAEGGSLNPTWVCWLMGFPLDWFDGVQNPKASRGSHTASKIESSNSSASETL